LTFAEMSLEEKQALSHRGHAIEILKSRKILAAF
jgi:XTP/dITP diphosphohydrolase